MNRVTNDTIIKQIASHIRNQIFTNELKEGEKIIEQKIADQVGTSRGPVKEAFTLLEKSGLITKIPRRGVFVVQIEEHDISEIYTLRLVIERLAVKAIIETDPLPDFSCLQEINSKINQLSTDPANKIALTEQDMKFHHELVFLSKNIRALTVWENLAMVSLLLSIRSRAYSNESQIVVDHQKIMDLMQQAREVEEAEKILTYHLETSKNVLLDEFEEKKRKVHEQQYNHNREFQRSLHITGE